MNESMVKPKSNYHSANCPGCGIPRKVRISKDQTTARFVCHGGCETRWSVTLPGQRLTRSEREDIFLNQDEPGTGFPMPGYIDTTPAPLRRTVGQWVKDEIIQKLVK